LGVEKLSRAASGSKGLIHWGAGDEVLCMKYCFIPKATGMVEKPKTAMQKENKVRMLRTELRHESLMSIKIR